jgi:hypothetical protein
LTLRRALKDAAAGGFVPVRLAHILARTGAISAALSLALVAGAHIIAPYIQARTATVTDLLEHRRSGVVSMNLSNGVRLHYRHLDSPQDKVVVCVAVLGAERLEDQHTRGLSMLAAGVLTDWTVSGAQAAQETGLAKTTANIEANLATDALQLRIACTPLDLDSAMRVAGDLLTHPLVDEAALRDVREKIKQKLITQTKQPGAPATEALYTLVFPDRPLYAFPPSPETLDRYSAADVQRWLNRHLTGVAASPTPGAPRLGPMPVEAAIVGDLSLEQAIAVAERSLGRLTPREPVTREPAQLPPIVTAPRARELQDTVHAGRIPGKADVIEGCFAPDMADLASLRALRVAGLVAAERVRTRLEAGKVQLVADVDQDEMETGKLPGPPSGGVDVQLLASPVPNTGMLLLSAKCEATKAPVLAAILHEELDALVTRPPTIDEIRPAALGLMRQFQVVDKDPRYWAMILSRTTTASINPELAINGVSFYENLTPARVADTINAHIPASRLRLLVLPEEK